MTAARVVEQAEVSICKRMFKGVSEWLRFTKQEYAQMKRLSMHISAFTMHISVHRVLVVNLHRVSCNWPLWQQAVFELLSHALFLHSLPNYLWHFLCEQPRATLWMDSRTYHLKLCTIIRIFKWLLCGQIFIPPRCVAVRNSYKHFRLLTWLDDVSCAYPCLK